MASDSIEWERKLVARCLAGDGEAWGAFIERFGPFLQDEIRITLRRFRGPADAACVQDVFQEVLLSLLKNDRAALRNFRWDSSLRRYLAVVAAMRVADFLRRRRPEAPLDPAALEAERWEGLAEPREPASSVEKRELEERIRKGLLRLPDRDRLALQLYYEEAFPIERLARTLSLTTGAAHVLLTRARQRIKDVLRNADFLCL